jgi:ABC-type Fe3+ transport system permease subunit
MFAHAFRFDHARFHSRVRNATTPRKPRQRWLRFAFGLLGLAVLVVLVMFSVVVGAVMLAAGLVYKLWHQRRHPVAHDPRVVDGEYRVVEKTRLPPAR